MKQNITHTMTRLVLLSALSGLLTGLVAFAQNNSGPPVTNSTAWNLAASATFVATPLIDNCYLISTTVLGELAQQGQNANSATVTRIGITMAVYDTCTGFLLFTADGTTTNGLVTVDPNLGSAKITATIPVIDETDRVPFIANVDVTLTGNGQPSPFQGNYKDNSSPGTTLIVQATGMDRAAQAGGTVIVSGYPTDHDLSIINDVDLTPQPAFSGTLEKFNSATVTITAP